MRKISAILSLMIFAAFAVRHGAVENHAVKYKGTNAGQRFESRQRAG